MIEALRQGRDAHERQAWAEACDRLSEAAGERPLGADDLIRLATAADLCGRDEVSADAWARAHAALLEDGAVERAARCAFWLAFGLMHRGERTRAGGWLQRAQRLLDDHDRDCVERGYLLLPAALGRLSAREAGEAHALFVRAAETGDRFRDPDLAALGRLGRGQARIRLGEVDDGVALLDEAMAAVEAGELSPVVVGTVYCAVIETCHEIFDLRRAGDWTEALTRWCEAQPELVRFRGQCRARRAEILQHRGAWDDALDEARAACERLAGPPGDPAAGLAFYRRAELHRLRGEFADAERAYGEAAKWGRSPQPGLALLRLAQGRVDEAAASIRREAEERADRPDRARVLAARVEIALAAGDLEAARASAAELDAIASGLGAPYLRALADQARSAVRLADGDPQTALHAAREAAAAWEELQAPREAARARVLVALACAELGDDDTARVELDAARWAFRRLGARPDLERVDVLAPAAEPPGDGHGLTPREIEVLRRVAAGDTNRAIAGRLSISERTVERHVSNLLRKLGVPNRSAATAWAFKHGIV
jgi:DNA-binding NarL/FixJ family response regulator